MYTFFFVDGGPYADNIPEEEGRAEGIKVARAPLNDALNPYSYEVYYKSPNGTESWSRSLPEGFTKETMLKYVTVRGAKSTDVMNDRKGQLQEIRFSAAKVNNTDYFIGVEEYIDHSDHGKVKVGLRFSKDLVQWTDVVYVIKESVGWDDIRVNYPIFLSKDGWSNTDIDIDDFYVIGTDGGVNNQVNKIHFQKQVPGTMGFATGLRMAAIGEACTIIPNPNKGIFKLSYVIDTLSHVEINMYSLSGQRLGSTNGNKMPGRYSEDFDISSYPVGIYLVAIRVRNRLNVYKVVKT